MISALVLLQQLAAEDRLAGERSVESVEGEGEHDEQIRSVV